MGFGNEQGDTGIEIMKNFLLFLLIAHVFMSSFVCGKENERPLIYGKQVEHAFSKEVCFNEMSTLFKCLKEKKDVKSYRLFNIWVSGDYASYKKDIFIGASKEESENWVKSVEPILLAGESVFGNRKNSSPFEGEGFTFELILDEPTYKTQKKELDSLQKKFPQSFKMTFIEKELELIIRDLKDDSQDWIKNLMSHYKDGNPALASDVIRIYKLYDANHDMNVYLDVDSLLERVKFIASEEIKALEIFRSQLVAEEDVVYSNNYNFGKTNDYLFVLKAGKYVHSKLKEIKSLLNKNIRDDLILLNHYQGRERFLKQDYSFYKKTIVELTSNIISHKKSFSLKYSIMYGTGPGFWKKCVANELSSDILVSNEESLGYVSKASWDPTESSIGSILYTDTEYLEDHLVKTNEELTNIVLLSIMGLDLEYFSHFGKNKLLILSLKKEIVFLYDWFANVFLCEVNMKRHRDYSLTPGLFGSGLYYISKNIDAIRKEVTF